MPLENLKGIEDFAKIDAQWIDEKSKNLASECDVLTTHQIRTIFSAVSRIRASWRKKPDFELVKPELILLKPKLAYQAGRKDRKEREALEKIKKLLDKAINAVITSQEKKKALNNFFALVESIVAYHKYYAER